MRNFIRNIILNYLPNKFSYSINIFKNIKLSYLEDDMPHLIEILSLLENKNGELVSVDIGANLGLFSYLLSKNSKLVVAIEPQFKLASYLKSVLPTHVKIINLAVSDFVGVSKLNIPKINGLFGEAAQQDALATIESNNPLFLSKNVDSVNVEVTTIDILFGDFDRIDFIKIDVEGHELSVLNGGLTIINKFKPIMMIELFKSHNPRVIECFDLLFSLNYICFYFTKNGPIVCQSSDSVTEIINNPNLNGNTVQNYFFCPTEKFNLIKSLI